LYPLIASRRQRETVRRETLKARASSRFVHPSPASAAIARRTISGTIPRRFRWADISRPVRASASAMKAAAASRSSDEALAIRRLTVATLTPVARASTL